MYDIGFANDFLDMITKHRQQISKKWSRTKIKNTICSQNHQE